MAGAPGPLDGGIGLEGLIPNWTFLPSRPSALARAARVKTLLTGLRPAPPFRVVRPAWPAQRWTAYFLFSPDGRLTPAHRFTLERLRALRRGLLVICAAPTPEMVPSDLAPLCDALCWKGLGGFDFSAYGAALRHVATMSPGADLLLLNDSVLGPFSDLDEVLDRAPWRVTGFTAWASFEHHLQSYAFHVRQVDTDLVRHLGSVLPSRVAFNRFQHVVNWQETRLAAVAARRMTVGALWFEPSIQAGDPSIVRALALLEAGFPFIKRSLAGGKLAARADQARVASLLRERGHPSG